MKRLLRMSLAVLFVAACGAEEPVVEKSASLAPGAEPAAEPAAEQPSAPPVAKIPSSADGRMQVGLSAAADYSLVYPTSVIPAATKRIAVAFKYDRESRNEKLTGTLVAVDVGDAAPPDTEVASTTINVKGSDRGVLHFTLPRSFPPGTYRVDATTADGPWSSIEFQIAPATAAAAPTPAALLPLEPGTTWTYDFTQRAGSGARMNLPKEQIGADGVYRSKATLGTTAAEEAGVRVEVRRAGELQTEEWWRAGATGIAATRSREDGQLTILDPPRPVFPAPVELPREWEYEAGDGSFKLEYRMWGPLPVEGPSGEAPGYIVFLKHDGPVVTTAERHFIPGVGMTKEVIVLAVGGRLMSRQEMLLRSVDRGGAVVSAATAY